jgi:hypothetical protein
MPTRSAFVLFVFVSSSLVSANARAQSESPAANDSIRVSVTMNEDGSHTSYQFDTANHKAVATTTERGGKPRGKIEYVLDDAGRFGSGKIYGPDGKFQFTAVYKYDSAGHLLEEARFGKDNQPTEKIVYDYDASGRQTGYSVLDQNGKVIGHTTPRATPNGRR